MASSKVLVIAAVLCAVALTVQAGGAVSGSLKLTGRKSIETVGNDNTAKLGDTAVLSFSYAEGAKLFQSGIYVDLNGKKLANYQGTLVLPKIGKWPAGSIFIVGSGTGVNDPASLDKSVVGGTGPYARARGTYSVKNGVTTIKLFK